MNPRRLVLDASTAILLAKVDLLRTVTESVSTWMVKEAFEEATCKEAPDALCIRKLAEDGLLHEDEIEEPAESLRKDFRLHEGEARSTLLARSRGAVCGTDDGPAIRCCKILGIPFVTAIGILIALKEAGDLDEALSLALLGKLERFGRYNVRIMDDAARRIRGGR